MHPPSKLIAFSHITLRFYEPLLSLNFVPVVSSVNWMLNNRKYEKLNVKKLRNVFLLSDSIG